jgi:hypothetical protein
MSSSRRRMTYPEWRSVLAPRQCSNQARATTSKVFSTSAICFCFLSRRSCTGSWPSRRAWRAWSRRSRASAKVTSLKRYRTRQYFPPPSVTSRCMPYSSVRRTRTLSGGQAARSHWSFVRAMVWVHFSWRRKWAKSTHKNTPQKHALPKRCTRRTETTKRAAQRRNCVFGGSFEMTRDSLRWVPGGNGGIRTLDGALHPILP